MAELPVDNRAAGFTGGSLPGGDFLRAASGLPLVRQLVLLFAIAGSVALAVVAVLWMRTPDYRSVTAITSAQQANEIVEVLSSEGIPHRIDDRSGMVLVPQDSLYEARMKLAGAGSVDGRQLGYELLDGDQGFGVSQFMELARHRRSVEGELARSIATINAVQSARVLLATPKSTTFLRDRRLPTASVTVKLMSGQSLTTGQVKGITNLVAGAVPELTPENVAVVDQSGKLLSGSEEDESLEQSERQLKYVARIEKQLQEKIGNILSPTVGPNRFSAEVSAEVDFTRSEEAEELYNPDLAALRSEALMNEERTGEPTTQGVPGVLTNQPPELQGAAGAAETETAAVDRHSRSQSTRNYELDRTVSYTQHSVGSLTRVSVSVVVDDLTSVNAETGATETKPWTEDELARLTTLVKNAVGYNPARGDMVTVVNSPFFSSPEENFEAAPFWTESWFFELLKLVLGGLVLLALVLGLLRPLFRNLSQAGAVVEEQQRLARLESRAAAEAAQGVGLPALSGVGGGQLPAGLGYSGKVETVRGLVEQDPGRVAQVVKHWVSSDE